MLTFVVSAADDRFVEIARQSAMSKGIKIRTEGAFTVFEFDTGEFWMHTGPALFDTSEGAPRLMLDFIDEVQWKYIDSVP